VQSWHIGQGNRLSCRDSTPLLFHSQLKTALAYVGLAMLLGALVGVDREMAHKPAGLRTHMLVSGASALLVALGEILVQRFDASLRHAAVQRTPCA
jgi:uncharacterized membrane protein YhiD involved in acid resistance